MRVSIVVLLIACSFIQQIAAGSLVKDFLILKLIGNLIKPRFVPLPLPVPLPIKFTKHTHKPYPVPVHSHAHHLGPSPLSFHLGGGYDGLLDHHDFSSYGHDDLSSLSYGHHDISALSSIDHDHHDISALSSIDHDHHDISALSSLGHDHHDISYTDFSSIPTSKGHYKLTSLPSLPLSGQLAVASIPSKYASASHLTASDRKIIQSLVDSAELTKVPSKKDLTSINAEFVHSLGSSEGYGDSFDGYKDSSDAYGDSSDGYKDSSDAYGDSSDGYGDSLDGYEDSTAKLQLSAANNEFLQNLAHASEINYVSTAHGGATHDDIDAVGGFDFLTDLHGVGESHEWWK